MYLLGVTPWNFIKIIGFRKQAVGCVMICLAVLTEHQLVTDERTDRWTKGQMDVTHHASLALHDKN